MNKRHQWRLFAAVISAAALMGGACQGPTSSHTEGTAQGDTVLQGTVVPVAVTSCYLHTHERDSVSLSITVADDGASGTLHFNNYQIDDSQGSVAGRFHGDTLFVIYDFQAEGTQNRTEEAFLKRGIDLIRGVGDREPVGNTYRFTDRGAIDFEAGQVFQPVPCE